VCVCVMYVHASVHECAFVYMCVRVRVLDNCYNTYAYELIIK